MGVLPGEQGREDAAAGCLVGRLAREGEVADHRSHERHDDAAVHKGCACRADYVFEDAREARGWERRELGARHDAKREDRDEDVEHDDEDEADGGGAPYVASVACAAGHHDGALETDEEPHERHHRGVDLLAEGKASRLAREVVEEHGGVELCHERNAQDEKRERHELGERYDEVDPGGDAHASGEEESEQPQEGRGADDGGHVVAALEHREEVREGAEEHHAVARVVKARADPVAPGRAEAHVVTKLRRIGVDAARELGANGR